MYATTFGSSKLSSESQEYKEGMEIASFLVSRGYKLKCGGYGGLMEAVSRGAKEAGGECIGYGLEYFEKIRPRNPYLSELIVCNTIMDRLKGLVEDSELFIVQKGEIGTLNELFLVWCLKYAGIDDSFRICVIGDEWRELKALPMINGRYFDMIEFYSDGADFIKRVF